jgi:hypothetical protein
VSGGIDRSVGNDFVRFAIGTIRYGLGGIFAFAAFSHLRAPNLFLLDVLNYQLINGSLAIITAGVLPFVELTVALLLCSRIPSPWPALLAWLLLVVFAVAQGSAWSRGLLIDCGCFGFIRASVGPWSLTLVGLLLAAASVQLADHWIRSNRVDYN